MRLRLNTRKIETAYRFRVKLAWLPSLTDFGRNLALARLNLKDNRDFVFDKLFALQILVEFNEETFDGVENAEGAIGGDDIFDVHGIQAGLTQPATRQLDQVGSGLRWRSIFKVLIALRSFVTTTMNGRHALLA